MSPTTPTSSSTAQNETPTLHLLETVAASTRGEINHALQSSAASLPSYEEFVSSRDALRNKTIHTHSQAPLSSLLMAFEVTSTDERFMDATIISLDDCKSKPEELLKMVQEHLNKFPAAPLIFCYSSEREILLPLMRFLGDIIYYPNVRFFNYALSLIEPPAEIKDNPFDVFRGPQYHKKGETESARRLLGVIEHQLGKHRKIDIRTIDEAILSDCLPQIESARLIGIKGNDRAVLEQIITVKINGDEKRVELPQVPFNMTCVDWDDTLMKNGVFQEHIWDKALSVASSNKQTLVVWTGGGHETLMQIQEFFKTRGQSVMTCAKQDCEGGIISYAIDDETGKDLQEKYGFVVSNLIPVS